MGLRIRIGDYDWGLGSGNSFEVSEFWIEDWGLRLKLVIGDKVLDSHWRLGVGD